MIETPAEILSHAASHDAAFSFVAWRKKLRKPLTERAALSIAKTLAAINAAGVMTEKLFPTTACRAQRGRRQGGRNMENQNIQWDEATRGPRMSGETGNRIWKYQMPVSEKFTMKLPAGADIIRMAGESGMLWLWAVVDTTAPDEARNFVAFKAGGTMPDDLTDHIFRGMAHIYIQAELMLYIFEVTSNAD